MRLIKPSFEILTPINGEQIIKDIEAVARTCYKSEDKIETASHQGKLVQATSGRKLVIALLKREHEAMIEFGPSITVKFICDRGVSHELVRHRLASFAQESTRYCNYGNDAHMSFIIPCWIEELNEGIYHGNIQTPANAPIMIWLREMHRSEITYNKLIGSGWLPQQARSILPNSLKTEINMKTNIRDWRHIFKLRVHKTAHPQMREVMIPLLAEFQKRIPILFDDITVEK